MNQYNIGDKVITKKKHPCGCDIWEITRIGVDYKLKCTKCGHTIMVDREKAYKMIKNKFEE